MDSRYDNALRQKHKTLSFNNLRNCGCADCTLRQSNKLIYKWLQSGVRCKVAPVERSKSGKSKAGRPQSGRETGKFNADYPKMALRTAARR